MNFFLPQNDKNTKRSSELETRRKDYAYDFQWQVPVGVKYYKRDMDSAEWFKKVASGLFGARDNVDEILAKTGWQTSNKAPSLSPADLAKMLISGDAPNLFDIFLTELGYIKGGGRPTSIDDYVKVFQTVQKTYTHERFMDDAYFAHSFVAGPHAAAFHRLKQIPMNFPLTNEIFRKTKEFASDDLQQAIAAGRVYLADYRGMSEMTNGVHPLQKKYIYQPIVAMAIPNGGRDLVPFAIQCGQDPAANPIFTPGDSWAWQMAKSTAWVAHYTYHELITHLGTTHLLIEPIVVATRRHLHESHPIYGLLDQHFEGTMLINNLAMSSLIQEGQAVDRLVGSSLNSNFSLIAKDRLNYSFSGNYLPNRLKSSGVLSARKLPNYHYRDDAIPIWNAIRAWVGRYIDRSYGSDGDIRADFELQKWAAEIGAQDGGRIKDFAANGGVDSKDQLIDTCTMIIFTAGPQHAAVNFPQLTDMSFLPGAPLAGYRPAPESTDMTEKDYLDILPPMDVAIKQWQTMHFLGSVRHTVLGQYTKGSFSDPAIVAAQGKFQEDLKRIEVDISNRNLTRLPYEPLKPSLIPQSVNI